MLLARYKYTIYEHACFYRILSCFTFVYKLVFVQLYTLATLISNVNAWNCEFSFYVA